MHVHFDFQVPADLDPIQLSRLSLSPACAYRLLKEFVNLEPGEVVLQNRGLHDVGQNVSMLAKAWGLKTVSIVKKPLSEERKKSLEDIGTTYVISEEDFEK
jgi:trans-2-enoyl-CoA reductase